MLSERQRIPDAGSGRGQLRLPAMLGLYITAATWSINTPYYTGCMCYMIFSLHVDLDGGEDETDSTFTGSGDDGKRLVKLMMPYTLYPITDECSVDGAECNEHATCQRVAGALKCVCNQGFTAAGNESSCVGK